MPIGTSLPPMPPKAALAVVAAGCMIVGAVLNLRGRTLARTVLPLAAAAVGAALSPWIVGYLPYKNVWVVGVIAALTLGLLAFVLARLFWSVVLGAMLAAGVVFILIRTGAPLSDAPAWPVEAPATFGAWCAATVVYAAGWVRALFAERLLAAVLATVLPVVACVVLEVLVTRSVLTVSTVMVGAALVIGGALALVWAAKADWAEALAGRPMVLAIAAGAVAAAGGVVQVGGGVRARAKAKEEEEKSKSGAEDENRRT